MPLLDSEALLAVHYDPRTRVLTATFRGNRRSYDYLGVPPEEYQALLAAESRGAYLNRHIKPRYKYQQRR